MKVRLGDYIKEYSVRNKTNEEIPVYSVTNSNGFCRDYFTKEIASKNKTTYKIVPKGYFAYNPSRINVGSVDWQRFEDKVIVSPLYNVFSVSNELNQQYLYYFLKSAKTVQRIKAVATGSVRDNLKLEMLYEFPIELLKMPEQCFIVDNLDRVQRVISLRKKELEGLDCLIKPEFVEMFGDPILNEKEWSCVMITDVCQLILGGGTPSKKCEEFFKGKIPWVTPKDMKQSIINDSIDHITEDAIVHSTTNLIPIWSVLMVIRSGILKHALPVAINSIPVTINQDMKAFIPGENITAEFLMYFFKAIEEDVLSKVRGVTADNIDFKTFQKREIIVPPMELQNQFAAFVTQVDKSKVVA